jgi:hypothetical protein
MLTIQIAYCLHLQGWRTRWSHHNYFISLTAKVYTEKLMLCYRFSDKFLFVSFSPFPIPHVALFEWKQFSLKITYFCDVSSYNVVCIHLQGVSVGFLLLSLCIYVRSTFSRLGFLFYLEVESISFSINTYQNTWRHSRLRENVRPQFSGKSAFRVSRVEMWKSVRRSLIGMIFECLVIFPRSFEPRVFMLELSLLWFLLTFV